MDRITVMGSHYATIRDAATAWAETALPDATVVDPDDREDVDPIQRVEDIAEEIVNHWATEAEKIGESITPAGVDGDVWFGAAVGAVIERIRLARGEEV